ncbi:MAG TPA: NifU family protein [Bacteroidales bacterium]|nr:NifU family protein [Bacteroidales bacterium]
MADIKEVTKKVEKSLESIRPYLQADGGDISLVEVSPEMVVKVRLIGACHGCPFSYQTLKAGVEQSLMKDVPEIKAVVAAE